MSSDLLHLHALAWKKVQIQKLQDCTASKVFLYSYALLSSDFMVTPCDVSIRICPQQSCVQKVGMLTQQLTHPQF